MTKTLYSAIGSLSLLVVILLPPFLYTFHEASSMALGVSVVAAFLIFLLVVFGTYLKAPAMGASLIIGQLALLVFIILHGAVAFVCNDNLDTHRFFQSGLLLMLLLVGSTAMANLAIGIPYSKISSMLSVACAALLLMGLASNFVPTSLGTSAFAKPVILFAEPSHFALSYLPLLLYAAVVSSGGLRVFLILSGYLMGYFFENLTMMVGVTLVLLIAIPWRWLLVLLPIGILLLMNVDFSYYQDRLSLSADSQNLSVLVYLQGWERAYLNLMDSAGWGIGFQQFGLVGSKGVLIEQVILLAGEPLNLFDGASLASKVVGEFGIFGVGVLLAYLSFLLRKTAWLHVCAISPKNMILDRKKIFFTACFVMYGIDLFVRSVGYFSPSGILFFSSLAWMAMSKPTHPIAKNLNKRS